MMNVQRYCPTFYRWFRLAQQLPLWQSTPVSIARDSWFGVERRCVIEIGRGIRRTTHWQSGRERSQIIGSITQPAAGVASMASQLNEDLKSVRAIGLPCDIVMNAPWAVAKVFPLPEKAVENPDHWIAQHREEVIPKEIADDVSLEYILNRAPQRETRLIVGLTRRSVVHSISSILEQVGSPVARIIHVPLHVLERRLPDPCPDFGLLLDQSNEGSCCCWLLADGGVAGWAEIIEGPTGSMPDQLRPEILNAYFGEQVHDQTISLRYFQADRYQPEFHTAHMSRWKIPKLAVQQNATEVRSSHWRQFGEIIQPWMAWLFRWSVVLAISALLLIPVGQAIKLMAGTLWGSAEPEATHWQEQRERLLSERDRLLDRSATVNEHARRDALPGQLWFDLGVAKTDSIWLRGVRLQKAREHKASWLVEGLSIGREDPYAFATNLTNQSGWQSHVVRLEVVDATRAKSIPDKLNNRIYQFAIEVDR